MYKSYMDTEKYSPPTAIVIELNCVDALTLLLTNLYVGQSHFYVVRIYSIQFHLYINRIKRIIFLYQKKKNFKAKSKFKPI